MGAPMTFKLAGAGVMVALDEVAPEAATELAALSRAERITFYRRLAASVAALPPVSALDVRIGARLVLVAADGLLDQDVSEKVAIPE